MLKALTSLTLVFVATSFFQNREWRLKLRTADELYETSVAKAEAESLKVVLQANEKRLKAYREALSSATKAGDFESASELKKDVEILEQIGEVRQRPKQLVAFGGSQYFLFETPVTWHLAKRRCEEMGGQLCSLETVEELQFVAKTWRSKDFWIGASDEVKEGEWRWVTGRFFDPSFAHINSDGGLAHHLAHYHEGWHDGIAGNRYGFLCEWRK